MTALEIAGIVGSLLGSGSALGVITADAALAHPVTIGSLVLAAITAIGTVVREVVRARKHARNNVAQERVSKREAEAERAKAEAAVKVAEIEATPGLLDRIETLWAQRDECKETLAKEREARRKERDDDAAACRDETARQVEAATAPLRAQLARVSEHAADTRATARGLDDTGVHELRAIAAEVRRTPTPPEGVPAQPERRGELMVRREIPPPRGKGETR